MKAEKHSTLTGILLREKEMALPLLGLIDQHGYPEPLCLPAISTVDIPAELPPNFDWVLFTSPRAVIHFHKLYPSFSKDIRVGSIGEATSDKIKQLYGIIPEFQSKIENAERMAEEWSHLYANESADKFILQPTSDIAGHSLEAAISPHVREYIILPIYKTVPHPEMPATIARLSLSLGFVVFYSPSGVEAWLDSGGENKGFRAISIGPVTTKKLLSEGFKDVIQSPEPHPEKIFETIYKQK